MHGNGPATVLVANITSLKGAWQSLRLEQVDLLILHEVRMSAIELHKLAAEANCQLVHGEEVEGEVRVAVLAWKGSWRRLPSAPVGRPTTASGRWAGST